MNQKRYYFTRAMEMPIDWLKLCADHPSPFMSRVHVLLIRLAIRKKETP